jgi:ankyrin repeat domain-containing protein 50
MPRSERTRDRLKRLVFRNHAASSETSPQTKTRSAPSDQETDPIGPNQPNLQIGASPIPPNQEVHLSNSTSAELQTTGSATSSTHEVITAPVRDLWTEALQKLSDKEKAIISKLWPSLQTNSTPDIPQHLIAVVEKKREECEEKRWKFDINGRQIILRDVAQKVIIWLNKLKEIGDVAVNFDPVHAALPWAGVRFLLQV